MNREEYAAWVQAAWVKDVKGKTPAAKAARQLKAGRRESRKAVVQARRTLAAQQASAKRKLDKRASDIEQEFRDRREVSDRKFEELRWAILMGDRSS